MRAEQEKLRDSMQRQLLDTQARLLETSKGCEVLLEAVGGQSL